MDYFQVANWDTLQHYKDRNPPWIKLHNSLLDDYNFSCLQDASKAHLIAIMMLASRTNNELPVDADWLQRQINATSTVDIVPLIDSGFLEYIESNHKVNNASTPLADRLQSASPERETEKRQSRGEKRQKAFAPPTQPEVHEYMKERGLSEIAESHSFVDFYESKGWMVGKNKMKSWQAAVRNWIKRKGDDNGNKGQTARELLEDNSWTDGLGDQRALCDDQIILPAISKGSE